MQCTCGLIQKVGFWREVSLGVQDRTKQGGLLFANPGGIERGRFWIS